MKLFKTKANFYKNLTNLSKLLIKYYKKAIKSYNKSSIWVKTFIIVAIVLLLIQRYNKNNPSVEGFSQMAEYIVKENDDLYDDFYVKYYDDITRNKMRVDFEFDEICHTTKPSKKKSKILDIGCGTGNLVKKFVKKGYKVKGVDKSAAMVKKADEKHPSCDFIQEDALNAMNHPANSFTHILCTYFTIYYIKDKLQFFNNAYTWLKPRGTMTLHLVNRDKFDPIVEGAKVLLMVDPQKYAKERITKSMIQFKNFKYTSDFKLQKHKNQAIFDEKFKDSKTGKVRENKHTLHMEKQKDILGLAKSVGFILEGKIDMKSCLLEHQYLYILRKP